MNKYYCGLDVSNKSTAICVVNEAGKIVKEQFVATSSLELQKALKGFRGLRSVVEASPLAESIVKIVRESGHEIEILDTRQAKIISATKKKTDKLDARKLAQMCRVGWYTAVHSKSGKSRSLRSYLTARMQIVKSATAMHSCIRGLFRAHGIVLAQGKGEDFEKRVREALKGLDEIFCKGIEPLLESWMQLQREEKRMYKELRREVVRKDETVKRLTSIPGVGPATAAAFAATIDDPRRFTSADQISSYIGLVPSVYQSGSVEIKGRITKHGDSLLRWLLVESATTLLTRTKKDCALKRWGLSLQEKKGFSKARVAVARKLSCLLFHVMRSGQEFESKLAA